jgi:hypothetical protein
VKVEESMEGWLVSLFRSTFQKGLESSLQIWLKNLKVRAEKNRNINFNSSNKILKVSS